MSSGFHREQERAEWLERVLHAAPAAIFTAGVSGGFPVTFMAESVSHHTGYDPSDYLSDPSFWIERVHPEDRARVLSDLESLTEGQPRMLEYRFRTASGSFRWLLDQRTLVADSGPAPFIVGSKIDFTFYRQSVEQLERSHRLFQDVDQYLRDCVIWILGPQLDEVVYISSGYEEVWGQPVDMVMADPHSWMDPILADDRPAVEAAAEGFATGDFDIEYRIQRPDGSVRWIWDRAFPVRNDAGDLVHVLGVAQDITSRKKSEIELERFFVVSLDLLCIADLDGHFLRVNPAFTEVLGWSEEELLARPFLDFVHPDDTEATLRAMARLEDDEAISAFENRYRTKDGGYRRLRWKSVPDPQHRQAYAAARDITEEHDAKEALRALNERLEEEVERRARDLHRRTVDLQCAKEKAQSIEEDLRRSERRYRELFQGSPLPMLEVSIEGQIIEANDAMIELLGFDSVEDLTKLDASRDVFVDSQDRERLLEILINQGSISGEEVRWQRRNGEEIWVRTSALTVTTDDGSVRCIRSFAQDITRERDLQKQLIQSQKMEAVGTLAGGVAHDFNNLLTVILANAELLSEEAPEASDVEEQLRDIHRAASQAKGVTERLLTFSRKAPAKRSIVDVNEMVEASGEILDRLIRDDIELRRDLAPDLPRVQINRTQLEQVVMNLVVNAQDAISGGGTINIRTGEEDLPEGYVDRKDGPENVTRVVLTVRDDGSGMDEKTQAQIFDPFFTTKDAGEGTGLGLSTVYGIIDEAGGRVSVHSEPGQGATFKIYLPPVEGELSHEHDDEVQPEALHGTETILLVDDEEGVRNTGARILRRFGYQVLTAAHPEEARRIFEEEGEGAIDLVLTDVVLPQMRGPELVARLQEEAPSLPVVYMSGFSRRNLADEHDLAPSFILIDKPFEIREFVTEIRRALDRATSGRA